MSINPNFGFELAYSWQQEMPLSFLDTQGTHQLILEMHLGKTEPCS
jgi:hypothetical protein